MANIVLTDICNLQCEYCFAPKESKTIEDDCFLEAIEFVRNSNSESINFIGGEPLLHKSINRYIEWVFLKGFKHITIFTNGIYLYKILDSMLKYHGIELLINVNSPKVIGDSNFAQLVKNIELLHNNNLGRKIHLGINIYQENQDVSYLIDIAKKYGYNHIRLAVAVPQDKSQSSLDYFLGLKNTILKRFEDFVDAGIVPRYDCNAIPMCFWNKDERQRLKELKERVPTSRRTVFECDSICHPVIDILPDLSVVRCFGLNQENKVNIREFCNIEEIKKYFVNCYDKKLLEQNRCPVNSQCSKYGIDCYAGCLGFIQES